MKKYLFRQTKTVYLLLVFCHLPLATWSWGFFAHKQINRHAITTLPPGMFVFYKTHLTFLTEKSVNPDKRRYVVKGEASKHFIDLEHYYTSPLDLLQNRLLNGHFGVEACLCSSNTPEYSGDCASPKNCAPQIGFDSSPLHLPKLSLNQAIEKYGDKMVKIHGKLPWAILNTQKQLTEAFKHKDMAKILKCSADLGHYIGDAHVPLHTTQNYNGQMTEQEGIHALWETRLPVLFFDTYNLFVGQAVYIEDLFSHTWDIVHQSHRLVDKVLDLEKQLSAQYPVKYSFAQEGNQLKKQYSIAFATAYHQALQGQVEARLQQSIIEVGNFWLTAWINAGAPNLDELHTSVTIEDEEEQLLQEGTMLEGIRGCGD